MTSIGWWKLSSNVGNMSLGSPRRRVYDNIKGFLQRQDVRMLTYSLRKRTKTPLLFGFPDSDNSVAAPPKLSASEAWNAHLQTRRDKISDTARYILIKQLSSVRDFLHAFFHSLQLPPPPPLPPAGSLFTGVP